MNLSNAEIADMLNEIADLLEIDGANPFRVRAYRTGSRSISTLARNVSDMVDKEEDLTRLSGIGKDLAEKVRHAVTTGTIPYLEELREAHPPGLSGLLKVPGLGPKKIKVLLDELSVGSTDDLKKAAEAGKIRKLAGFGAKTEQNILDGLVRSEGVQERFLRFEVKGIADSLVEQLKALSGVHRVTVAGSYRRCLETVGDLDILVTCDAGEPVMEGFTGFERVSKTVSKGDTRSTVILTNGLQVDVRVVPEKSYGAALHYFTGSKAHNIALRTRSVKQGFKVNEYGVFKGEEMVAGADEEEVYGRMGLSYIPPELREDRGEIEAALEGSLPELIESKDILGDLHVHTTATDGRSTLEDLARAAQNRGYAYLAVTDHTQSLKVAKGQGPKRLMEQMEAIDSLNERFNGFVLLKGAEVDILKDGSLDLPDDVLSRLDMVVCAVHSHFKLGESEQTERILRAMDSPYCHILAHPSGRLIDRRPPYAVDMDRIIEAAADNGCILELNGQPDRLDLTDVYCRAAKEAGVKVAISSDAHDVKELDILGYGIDQARRGWLEPGDVVNTLALDDLRKILPR